MVEKVIIVSVHVRYFSFFSFLSLCLTGYVRLRRLHQVTSVYVGGTGRGARQYENSSHDFGADLLFSVRAMGQIYFQFEE